MTGDVVLKDADEIERFYLHSTGMKPDYLQLSAGAADLRLRAVELAGVTLVWARPAGHTRWRDEMTGDGLHLGIPVESAGPISARGRPLDVDDAQVWITGREMDYVIEGPSLTLEVGVEAHLVEELQSLSYAQLPVIRVGVDRVSIDVLHDEVGLTVVR